MATLPEAKLYIDGVVRRAAGDRLYDNIGPWTADLVGQAADATPADVDAAIAAARRAFDATDWPTNKDKRVALVAKLLNVQPPAANPDNTSEKRQ